MTRTQPDTPTNRPTMLLVGWAASVVPLGDVDGIEACAGDGDGAATVSIAALVPTPLT
jgi:hypothetical protein